MSETRILRRIASQSIENNYGLFVATNDEDLDHQPVFVQACRESGIPIREISGDKARAMEPELSPSIRSAVVVPDGTIDAFRLPMQFFAAAQRLGAQCHSFSPVVGLERRNGAVVGVHVRHLTDGRDAFYAADLVINAAGAWGEKVAGTADVDLPLTPAPGTMVAISKRLNNMVISRLHPVGDGDIIVAQRNLSIVGSTQWITSDPDDITIPRRDIDSLMESAKLLIPSFSDHPIHASWTAVRPLAGDSEDGGRELSRDFACLDHGKLDGVSGLLSVTGGKATVLRAMAEKTVDVVCELFDARVPCTTAERELPAYLDFFRQRAKMGASNAN
jgi:glycerol-3-phosphate dehydrogenase